jgi:hypothetical protein
VLSTMFPSESMILYVEMAGLLEGLWKVISDVNLLFTAPGKCTLKIV